MGGWAAREVKSGACAGAEKIPKGKELSLLVASGRSPPGDRHVASMISPGSKERWKFALGSLTDSAAIW